MCRYLDITPPRWVEEQYRICADVSEGWGEDGVGGGLNVFYLEQTLILSPPPHLNLNPDANPNPEPHQVWEAAGTSSISRGDGTGNTTSTSTPPAFSRAPSSTSRHVT